MNTNKLFTKNLVIISAYQKEVGTICNSMNNNSLLTDLLSLLKYRYCERDIIPGFMTDTKKKDIFVVVMPDKASEFDYVQEQLIKIGDNYNQDTLLLIFNKPDDPPTGVLYPLDKGIQKGYEPWVNNPWIQITKSTYMSTNLCMPKIHVKDKYFMLVDNIDVTPIEIQEFINEYKNEFY